MVAANANLLGVSIGYFYPSLFVSDSSYLSPDQAKNNVMWLLISEAMFGFIALILITLFFKKDPKVSNGI